MDGNHHDDGVIAALVERSSQRLPRALAIQERVENGATLRDSDIEFLDRVFDDYHQMWPLVARHPEYEPLVGRMIDLYHDITARALANEQHGR